MLQPFLQVDMSTVQVKVLHLYQGLAKAHYLDMVRVHLAITTVLIGHNQFHFIFSRKIFVFDSKVIVQYSNVFGIPQVLHFKHIACAMKYTFSHKIATDAHYCNFWNSLFFDITASVYI